MKTPSEYRRERDQVARRLQQQLRRKVASFQRALYGVVVPIFDTFERDGDNVTFGIRNISKTGEAQRRILDTADSMKPGFIGWIIKKADQLFNLNRLYFKSSELSYEPEVVDFRVRQKIFRNLGYDVQRNVIIPRGWIDTLTDVRPVALQVAQDMTRAMATRMPLNVFKETFRKDFISPDGLGYLERHYNTFAFDLYQSVDRETQNQYSEELGLNYALYSGTIKNNTRPFCRARVQHYYSKDEIRKWKNLEFKGKLQQGYDPFIHCGGYNCIHCGGYNCRHHLSFVSEEYLKRRGLFNEVNKYS